MVKPPRNIQRKQEQFGTSHKKVTTPAARVASLSGIAPNIFKAAEHKVRINPSERDTAQASEFYIIFSFYYFFLFLKLFHRFTNYYNF